MDTYQGKMSTVSPAFANYDIQTYVNIDKDLQGLTGSGTPSLGVTGIGATGVRGTGTLELVNWAQGVTGINITNAKDLRYFI